MPKLKEHFQVGGTRFNAHVADAPQCGPSRSSTLTGKLVHNHGYWINGDPTYKTFVNWAGHNNNTVGTWLTAAGYHTAFLGSECARWPAPLGARSASLLTARRAQSTSTRSSACRTPSRRSPASRRGATGTPPATPVSQGSPLSEPSSAGSAESCLGQTCCTTPRTSTTRAS